MLPDFKDNFVNFIPYFTVLKRFGGFLVISFKTVFLKIQNLYIRYEAFFLLLLFRLRYQIDKFQSIPSSVTKSGVPRVCLPECSCLCFKMIVFLIR